MTRTARAHALRTSGAHIAAATVRAIAAAAREVLAAAAMTVRSLVTPLLAAPAAVTRTEPVLTSARLPDRELGNRPRRRLLPVGTRQRSANQPSMDRTVVV